MPRLKSVHIERFKRISDAPFDLENINVLVGANNSGKSSIIQGLHFAIGILQTVFLGDGRLRSGTTSLNPTELIYSPSDSIYALGFGGKLAEEEEKAIRVELTLDTGEMCEVLIRKGHNRNVKVHVVNPGLAKSLGKLDTPFTIFSPGLAGIAKSETYLSDGILLRTLARGDANLILRNILYRLSSQKERWSRFLNDLHEVFPDADFNVAYDEKTDVVINIVIKTEDEWVPLELAGTGVLQATQILSYVHYFSPSLIVLDEPDTHLHPNNQRLLCTLLRTIAEERETQVLLTTHSRHVVDALGNSARLLWVRNATVDVATRDDEIGILLDIGALDIKERISVDGTKAIVLTEDENHRLLEILLESSGFAMNSTIVLPYYGATTIKNLRPLVKVIQGNNKKAKIVLHRDRDYYSDADIQQWEVDVRNLGVEPFVTLGTDIESHFVNVEYLAKANNTANEEIQSIIDAVGVKFHDKFVEKYINGHVETARQTGTAARLNLGELGANAPKLIAAQPARFRQGKMMLAGVREEFKQRTKKNLIENRASPLIAVEQLKTIAKKVFGNGPKTQT